jgi:hypothetical protein
VVEGVVTLVFRYADINIILDKLLANIQAVLASRLVDLYIHSSLAYGDFNPQTSDIDFLIVTDNHISSENITILKSVLAGLFANGFAWSQKLEGAYLPNDDLHCHDPAHTPGPCLGVDGALCARIAWERMNHPALDLARERIHRLQSSTGILD